MINILVNLNNHKENISTIKEVVSYIELQKEKILSLGIVFKKDGFRKKIEINKKYNKEIEESDINPNEIKILDKKVEWRQ